MSIDDDLLRGLEAVLFVADEPLPELALAAALECDPGQVSDLLDELGQRLLERGAGIELGQAAGGWRLYTSPLAREQVERHLLAGRSGRLSQAALETLAVIAYKQPISRTEVGDIRGVNADGAVRSLAARGLVEEVGRDDGPGQAVLYGTTTEFLEKLGLDSLDDLPELTDYLPEEGAPDEPGPDQLREARRRLALGVDLPSTGRSRWDPDDQSDPEADEASARQERRREEVARRRSQEADMQELSGALERAAKSAVAQLREAVEATERAERDDEDDEDDDGPSDDATETT